MIQTNIQSIQEHIALVCNRLGKNPEDIIFVGVTKYADVEQIKEVLKTGITHIGENRVQEAKEKFVALENLGHVTKHMIGHLQTNKVKDAVVLFDVIQSVDSFKVAQEIEKQAAKLEKTIDVLIEVNISGEEQKHGFIVKDVMADMEMTRSFSHMRIKGLMGMAPFVEDKDVIRNCFRQLKKLFEEAKEKFLDCSNIEMKYLSMGMTADYEMALEEGSNMVRIGRAMYV